MFGVIRGPSFHGPARSPRHSEAARQHKDGSPVNVCRKCESFVVRNAAEANVGRGFCNRHQHGNMWFGNCDDWWPQTKPLSLPSRDPTGA